MMLIQIHLLVISFFVRNAGLMKRRNFNRFHANAGFSPTRRGEKEKKVMRFRVLQSFDQV